jgi:uncharacterized protein (DUF2062 family)
MTPIIGVLVAAVVGIAIAVGSSVAVVQVATQKPDPVTKPIIVYGSN